ncbi:MAG: alpha/beta hydrolase [Chloroflexi bacterium]|nr:alpha/beta hydrolase [Chloroflexota bacterium]
MDTQQTATPDPARLYKSPEGYAAMRAWYESALAQLPVDVESRYVATRYGRTHLLVTGPPDAPPLVLVQGYGASAPLWHKQIADFAAEYRVYALDTVGHPGRSDPNPPPFFDDAYAKWLVDVLDALGLERVRVAGVCLGGWVVIRLGIYAPERVEKAVLLSPVGLARFKIYIRSGVPLILNMGGDLEAAGQRLLVHAFTPPGSNLTFDRQLARALTLTIKYYRINTIVGIQNDDPTLREMWQSARILFSFVRGTPRAELRRFDIPTLLIVGEHEAIYNAQAAVRRARAALPHVRAEIIPGTGHAAIYDRPDVVNPLIMDFLRA